MGSDLRGITTNGFSVVDRHPLATASAPTIWPIALISLRRFFDLPRFHRRLVLRRNFVFRLRNIHQPVVKPANNMLQPLDAMPRLAGTGKLVRLGREKSHVGWNLWELQRTKHLLAACAGRRAIVSFPEDEHHRRF